MRSSHLGQGCISTKVIIAGIDMTDRLKNKIALVTGAGGKIGREIARQFATEGASVACVDINEQTAAETANLIIQAGGHARAYAVDIGNRQNVLQLFEKMAGEFGGLDILVNNAMWIRYEPIEEVEEDTVEKMFSIGLKSIFWAVQAALPKLEERGGGSIINISSIAAIRGSVNRLLYCTIKGGVNAMTMQCAVELGPRNIRVNAIAPGAVLHEASAARLGPELIQLRRDTTPLGRLPEASDIASTALFLASDDSRLVTGELICVDGGRRIVS